MAGGITTPEFIAAVSNAGGLGSLATGYLSPAQVKEAIQKIKLLTTKSFSVNIFIPQPVYYDEKNIQAIQALLAPYYEQLNLSMPDPQAYLKMDAYFEEILTILYEVKIPFLSFTFGCLSSETIQKFHNIGTKIIGTATTPQEAVFLAQQGCDAIIAQGIEAGGHRGSFLDNSEAGVGLMSLIPLIKKMDLGVPIFAAGGLSTPEQLLSSVLLGAHGCVVGTALLTAQESGASVFYQQQLIKGEGKTQLTPNFTGKMVRATVPNHLNKLIRESGIPVPDYPIMHVLTQPLRKASPEQLGFCWAGQSYPLVTHRLSVKEAIHYLYQACMN
jgi:nitronate monooxygenase